MDDYEGDVRGTPEPGTEREDAIGRRMERTDASGIEKALMAFAGAAEGLATQLKETHLSETAADAAHKATAAFREIRQGLAPKAEASSFEGQQTWDVAGGGVSEQGMASRGIDRLRHAAEAVGEASLRAARLPAGVAHDARTAGRRVAADAGAAGRGFGLAALFGLGAFALATWLITGLLSMAVGWLWAVFLVALVYAVIAGMLVSNARRRAELARTHATQGLEQVSAGARTGVRGITGLLRDALRPPGEESHREG